MKKWRKPNEIPPEHLRTVHPNKKPLLLLVEGVPHPVVGTYTMVAHTWEEGEPVSGMFIPHFYEGKTHAWTTLPAIPEEFWKVTGYDKLLESEKRTEAHEAGDDVQPKSKLHRGGNEQREKRNFQDAEVGVAKQTSQSEHPKKKNKKNKR